MAEREPLRTACGCSHRRHALEHIIAKREVVNESNGGMATDQGPKRPRAEFMRQMKRGPERLVLGHQCGICHTNRENGRPLKSVAPMPVDGWTRSKA